MDNCYLTMLPVLKRKACRHPASSWESVCVCVCLGEQGERKPVCMLLEGVFKMPVVFIPSPGHFIHKAGVKNETIPKKKKKKEKKQFLQQHPHCKRFQMNHPKSRASKFFAVSAAQKQVQRRPRVFQKSKSSLVAKTGPQRLEGEDG